MPRTWHFNPIACVGFGPPRTTRSRAPVNWVVLVSASEDARSQRPRQTPSKSEPLMQREPSLQSLSCVQYFAPFTRSLGTLGLTSPEFISMPEQAPFRQLKPGLQSVSNTQARAGIEVRQRTPTMTRPRIVVPCEKPPKITPRNVQIWTAVAPVVIPSAWASQKSPGRFGGAMFDAIQLEISPSSVPFRPQPSEPAPAKF
jgi:hypothetical protein